MKKYYLSVTKCIADGEWMIWVGTALDAKFDNRRYYFRKSNSPSARRCARLLAKIAEGEA
jgi:hypothetical protein